MNRNLYALLRTRFPADRAQPCFLLPDGREISYGALETGAGRLAALLKARGVGPGDRVLVQAPKSVELVMLYLATLQRGAVFTPLILLVIPFNRQRRGVHDFLSGTVVVNRLLVAVIRP